MDYKNIFGSATIEEMEAAHALALCSDLEWLANLPAHVSKAKVFMIAELMKAEILKTL